MSQADDILFAPIDEAPIGTKVDFFVRPNSIYPTYDWKPNSTRAHNWAIQNYDGLHKIAVVQNDGWMIHFSSIPGANPKISCELAIQNYIFEEVA